LDKRRFSTLVAQQLPYIHSISMASAYSQEELEPLLSPRFMLKQSRIRDDGEIELIPYRPQSVNVITNFIYPLTPETKPLIGLDILSLKLLDPLFNRESKNDFVRLLEAPTALRQTVTRPFDLFGGGSAISINQAIGERPFNDKVYPQHITTLIIELDEFRNFLANFIGNDALRIKLQTEDNEAIWFGKRLAPRWYEIAIQEQQTYQLLGRDIILQSEFSFGLKQINWQLMLVLTLLGLGAIYYFNKLYSVIQRKQRNLIAANSKLTHNLKTQSDMLEHISHELNTPLTLIGLANQQLQKEKGNDEQSTHVVTIDRQLKKMTNLVRHILEVKTAQRLTLNPQPQDIVAHIKQILSPFKAQFAQKNIQFLHIESHVQTVMTSYDHLSLEMVLENMLTNACKYTDAFEWVEVYLNFEIGDDDDPKRYLVLNIDNAHDGLTPQQCEQIFTKFVRINTQHIQGSGLGLDIVKEVCARNDWLIECYSGVKPNVAKQFGKDGYVAFKLSIPV
jgi:signal transduction histidine kinase